MIHCRGLRPQAQASPIARVDRPSQPHYRRSYFTDSIDMPGQSVPSQLFREATGLLTTAAISNARPSSVTSWCLPGAKSRPCTVLPKRFS